MSSQSLGGAVTYRNELDPLGTEMGTSDPYVSYPSYQDLIGLESLYEERGNPFDPSGGCGTIDGLPASCSEVSMRLRGGSLAVGYEGRERDPSQPPFDPRPPRYIPVQRPIDDYGIGLYGVWVPGGRSRSEFRKGARYLFFTDPQDTVTAPIGDIKGNLQKILSQKTASGTCEEYTTNLLAEAAKMFAGDYPHINTVMEGYEKISGPNGGGYILKQHPYDTVDGDLFANGARPGAVWLVPNRQYESMSKERIAEFQADYAWTALHETFHLGKQGHYNDEQLAAAAYALAGLKLPSTSQTGLDRAYFYSGKFDAELVKHCPKLQANEVGK